LGIALAVIALLTMIAVPVWTAGNQEQSTGTVSTGDPWFDALRAKYSGVTLNMSVAKHVAADALREEAKVFTEKTGIQFKWDVAPETSGGLRNKQLMAISMGADQYDIMMVDTFWITEYVEKMALADLDALRKNDAITIKNFEYEDFNPGFRSSGVRNGTAYALPLAGATRVVAYRTDVFEQQGWKEPADVFELLAIAKKLKQDVPKVDGMTMRAQSGMQFASGWLQWIYQFSDGFVNQKTGEVIIDTEPVIKSLEYFIDLLKTGPDGIESFAYEEAASAFATGQAALWYDGTPIVMSVLENKDASSVIGKIGYMAPPPGPEGAYAPLAGWLIGIANQSKNKEAAWAFLSWVSGKDKGYEFYKASGQINRDSVFNDSRVTKGYEDYFSAYQEALNQAANLSKKNLDWIPPTPNEVLVIAGEFGNRALLGELTPKQACEEAAKQIRAFLKERSN
jgi:ABC-type glycerol-3-phosphate transport system substrate-binding protein